MNERVIVDYYAVSFESNSFLTDSVKHMMKDGWQPFGSLSTVLGDPKDDGTREIWYSQALVKYED